MKLIRYLIITAFVMLLIGCAASMPPQELVDARQAYLNASNGQATKLVPAELHKAKVALETAEKSFLEDPNSYSTKDLAYIADRKAKMAEGLANSAAERAATEKSKKDYEAAQTEILKRAKDDLAKQKLKADKLESDLAKLAAKEDERGLVITLSGSVLFASNESTLMPAAKTKLNEVADALLTAKERKLTIEGHTDSQGSANHNMELAQRRAESVRSYIISRGYPENMISAQGIGESRPVGDNSSAEGRANNRRVEIIIARTSN